MFESLGRGWKMIMASVRMGLEDKRLLIPSLITVFNNFFFAILIFGTGAKIANSGAAAGQQFMHKGQIFLAKHLEKRRSFAWRQF